MHSSVIEFVKKCPIKGKVLEIGSLFINGEVKSLLKDCEYIGLDMQPGLNVDIVANANRMEFGDEVFDCVLYLETIEHDMKFWKTLEEIKRVLKCGGVFVFGAPGIGFKYHPYPKDYYRFTPDFVEDVLAEGYETVYNEPDKLIGGLFFCGKKL